MYKSINGVKYPLTEQEITERNDRAAAWEAGQSQRDYDDAITARKRRYQEEADPLYMEWQYDNSAGGQATWRAKVAEIKAAIPLPVV